MDVLLLCCDFFLPAGGIPTSAAAAGLCLDRRGMVGVVCMCEQLCSLRVMGVTEELVSME